MNGVERRQPRSETLETSEGWSVGRAVPSPPQDGTDRQRRDEDITPYLRFLERILEFHIAGRGR